MRKRRKWIGVALVLSGVLVVSWALVSHWGKLRVYYLLMTEFDEIGDNDQGLREFRHIESGIVFVELPRGRFTMGSPEGEPDRKDHEGPQHEVVVSSFLISKYEVGQEEWRRVMGENPARYQGADRPVEQVSWDDCLEFCRRTELSLPTEAQWEYACRAGTEGLFAGDVDELGWHQGNTEHGRRCSRRGTKKPNAFGVYDLHGNVWEWCLDNYDALYYRRSSGKDPVCTSASDHRVARGGCVYDPPALCRSAYRGHFEPSSRRDLIGFRVAFPLR